MPRAIRASLLLILAVPAFAQDSKPADPAPLRLTDRQDHKLMMDALGITSLRPGANGMNRNAPNAANYDESKVKSFTLPDPLVCKDGTKVTALEQWWTKRRPEIVEDFDREVYGRVPKDVTKVMWDVTSTTREKVGDIPAITKKLMGRVDNSTVPADQGRDPALTDDACGSQGPCALDDGVRFRFRRIRPQAGRSASERGHDESGECAAEEGDAQARFPRRLRRRRAVVAGAVACQGLGLRHHRPE